MMKSNLNLFRAFTWGAIGLCLFFVVMYENDILLSGSLKQQSPLEFYCAMIMEVVTICLIPLSLRLFKFKGVRQGLREHGDKAMRRWGLLRLLMLCLPMVVNTWLYYQFMNVAFGYLGIIGLLSLAFVFPSASRYKQEME